MTTILNPEKKPHGKVDKPELHVDLGSQAASDLMRREFENAGDLPDLDLNDLPLEVMTWNVLIEPKRPPQMVNGIAIAMEAQDAERFKTNVGRLLAMGDAAFQSRTTGGIDLTMVKKPVIGQFVMYRDYTGKELIMQKDGRRLMVMDDTDIIAIIKNPADWRMYL